MELNGKACFLGSLEDQKVKKEDIKKQSPGKLVSTINQYSGEEAASINGNTIVVSWNKNPAGLKISDGFCLCPLVENGPKELSKTYCHCSVGYVKEMFETYLKSPVQVELLESLRRGGKSCKFKITYT